MKENGFDVDSSTDVVLNASPGGMMVSGVTASWSNTFCADSFKNYCFLVLPIFRKIWVRNSHILSWHHVFASIIAKIYRVATVCEIVCIRSCFDPAPGSSGAFNKCLLNDFILINFSDS